MALTWPRRRRCYGRPVAASARIAPELLDRLVQCGELAPDPALDKLLRQASRPTLARLLAPARARYPLRGATTTRPSTWLKQQIPIRTFTEWNDARPGFLEVDLVAHCGAGPCCRR